MAVIQAENVLDFANDTLKDLGKPKYTDISSVVQNHVAVKHLMNENRMVLESGQGIQFNILVGQSNAARMVGLAESDNVNLVDGMIQASTVWRNAQTSYMIIDQLMALNREPSRIVDYVKQQRYMALVSKVELLESQFWTAPSATDLKTSLGLPYWVTKNATKGFNGGTLSGYTTVANVNSTTYSQWNNFTYPFTAISTDDFVRTSREAADRTQFMPPVDGQPSPNTGDEYGFYTNLTNRLAIEELLMGQNDNLGHDVAAMDGKGMFRRTPVVWVPFLDRDTTNPFYGLNWGWLKLYIVRGWWFKQTSIPYTPGQHTVASHFIDSMFQFVSKNRRCHFVGSNGTTYPG